MKKLGSEFLPHRGGNLLALPHGYRGNALRPVIDSRAGDSARVAYCFAEARLLRGCKRFPNLRKRPCINAFFYVHLQFAFVCSRLNDDLLQPCSDCKVSKCLRNLQ